MANIIDRIKSVLVLGGTLPLASDIAKLVGGSRKLIAADGAAWVLHDALLAPHYIVGDLDSFRSHAKACELSADFSACFPNCEIIELPDQETNDFEKALRLISERKLDPVMVLGMQGGDLEHSFNNWSVATKFSSKVELWISEGRRSAIGIRSFIKAQCSPGSLVSLIPQPRAVLSTSGLRWPLQMEELALGVREGARNQVVDSEFSIQVHSGSVLVFLDSQSDVIELAC